jgi:hypothetical protein
MAAVVSSKDSADGEVVTKIIEPESFEASIRHWFQSWPPIVHRGLIENSISSQITSRATVALKRDQKYQGRELASNMISYGTRKGKYVQPSQFQLFQT